jgi:molybdenum cofactor cytidylyltransferase
MALRVDGILLAAGESRRMGYPKPLLEIDGRTFVEDLARKMLRSVTRLIVVTGAHAAEVRRAVPEDRRIVVVDNPDYARGQLSSLKTALAHGDGAARAVLAHLVDHPTVRAETFSSLIGEYERSHKPIAIARYRGRRGHPVIFDRSIFAEVIRAPEEQGARAVVDTDPSRVAYLDTDDAGVVLDLDTPDDLEKAGLPRIPRRR